ncbi:MAG: hypothetical protein EBS01_12910, partial [Verrucomicrobia bacterium]|nr:hypothetical protein [Verrucomicrobiota bacterium]
MQYPNQPAWVQPALGFITSGPAGLTREPGCSLLPELYRGAYFVADWRGGRSNSPLVAFWLEPQGMGFKIRKQEDLVTGTLPTDATFGPDGRLYISDMVEFRQQPNGGKRTGRGWIWAVSAPVPDAQRAAALEVRDWLKAGFEKEADSALIQRLGHADYRVRLEAQFTLAERGLAVVAPLTEVTLHHPNRLARIHALQALGQLQRGHGPGLKEALPLLTDADDEMRAQIARQLVDAPLGEATPALLQLLSKTDTRGAYFAAQALGRLGRLEDIAPLADLLRRKESDPALRHAGVAALERLAELPGGRERVVREAIRAVNDMPIPEALPALAALDVKTATLDVESARRVLNARYRLGRPEDSAAPPPRRAAALRALAHLPSPQTLELASALQKSDSEEIRIAARDTLAA